MKPKDSRVRLHREALENAYFHGNLEVSSVMGYDLSQYSAVAAERLLELRIAIGGFISTCLLIAIRRSSR
ncbi:MAG: hypothetical protein R3B91_08270 [Planctomycetaceae bacterium]